MNERISISFSGNIRRQWQLVRVGESKAEMIEQEGKDVRVNAWEIAAHRVQVERKGK